MNCSSRRILAALSVAAVTVVGLGSAQATPNDHPVRASDIDASTQHVADNGTLAFLKEGVRVSLPDGQDYIRALFDTGTDLADVHSVTFDWFGTGYGSQSVQNAQSDGNTAPISMRYNVDVDGDGSWDCQLVGERANGDTDVWLNVNQDLDSKVDESACEDADPGAPGNSGSEFHGDLDVWATNLGKVADTTPVVVQTGFVASDNIVNGVLRSISLGDEVYAFTSEAAPVDPTPVDVTGDIGSFNANGNYAVVDLATDKIDDGSTEGDKVDWEITTSDRRVGADQTTRLRNTMGAHEFLKWTYSFPSGGRTQVVRVLENGNQVKSFLVRP